jgi:WD40 repeat protein
VRVWSEGNKLITHARRQDKTVSDRSYCAGISIYISYNSHMAVVLATGGLDHKIRFWEATSGACIRTLNFSDTSQVNCLAISPDKSLLAAGGSSQIHVFDVTSTDDKPIMTYEHGKQSSGMEWPVGPAIEAQPWSFRHATRDEADEANESMISR